MLVVLTATATLLTALLTGAALISAPAGTRRRRRPAPRGRHRRLGGRAAGVMRMAIVRRLVHYI